MIKLREIPEQMESLLVEYNHEDTTDDRRLQLEKELEKLEVNIDRKADAIADLIASFDNQADFLKHEIDRLTILKKRREGHSARLKNYLSVCLWRLNLVSLETDIHRYFFTKSESVQLLVDAAVPMEYCREVPAKLEPDKALIKNAIKSGIEIDGARLEVRQNLQIR